MSPKTFLAIILVPCILWSCKKDKTPSAPTNLIISNISDTGATISWNQASYASSYDVYISTDAGFKSDFVVDYTPAQVQGFSTSTTRLRPGTHYFVRVIAKGKGESSPVSAEFTTVDGDGLVIIGSDDNAIYALNARNGDGVWTVHTGGPVSATPIIQDSLLYIGSQDGKLYAMNVWTGIPKWTTSKVSSGSFISAAVNVYKGTVYVGDYGGWVYAFDAKTGFRKWWSVLPTPYRNINTAPIVPDDTTLYVASYDGMIYNLDATTGLRRWSTGNTGNPLVSGPALVNNTLYVGAFPKVYAFDAKTGAQKWRTTTPVYAYYDVSPTISGDNVLIGDGDGIFYSYSTADGTMKWSRTLSQGSIETNPVVSGNIVYTGGGMGTFYALDVATGNIIWQKTDLSKTVIYGGPVVTDKYIYLGTLEGIFYCLEKSSGVIKWSKTIDGASFDSSPSVITNGGKTFFPGSAGTVQ
ncbi:MAG: PQQ-binding-like beta-propeller repeat protein [Bacteroidetes bacterium]|nr:PQQ-binding-like beta-propeller repeat protein [Bacteroidota bacterium]